VSEDITDGLPILHLGHPREPWRLCELTVRTWAKAAAVCLEVVGHRGSLVMTIVGLPHARQVQLEAPTIDDAVRRTYRNMKTAVEHGALAVVASLVQDLTDETFLEQAVEGTGIDYWLVGREEPGPILQGRTRLEISGILREDPSTSNTIQKRLRDKHQRIDKYPDERPAKIAIVEFSAPRTVMETHV
jgi:hypothetical protein